MILFNGLPSILESLYLGDDITDKLTLSDIVVNPINSSYLSGKTIILNMPNLNKTVIENILNKGNTVVSRIPGYNSKIKVIPYLEKPLFNVFWNWKTEDKITGKNIDQVDFQVDYPNIYFPKAKTWEDALVGGYPSALGILLHQVGQDNVINNKLFYNLDLQKIKKGIL